MWQDKKNKEFTITCGDGQVYTVLWKNPQQAVEYNLATFEFGNIPGTLVPRGQVKGRRFPMEFYFQGDDHLDVSAAFMASSADPAPLRIDHPFYGVILCQPIGFLFDNSYDNITKVTGSVIETITEDAPQSSTSPADEVEADKETADEALAQSYATDAKPKATDIGKIKETNSKLYEEGKKSLRDQLSADEYFNAFNTANTAVNNVIAEPLNAIRAVQRMVNAPAQFVDAIRSRINTLVSQFNLLRNTLSNLVNRPDKKLYEATAGTLVGAVALASVTRTQPGTNDYNSAGDVLQVIEDLLAVWDGYIADLDAMQTLDGGSPNSYIPDAPAIIAVSQLVQFAVSNLFTVASRSRQERSIVLPDDTNLIVFAYRYMGLKPDDSTLNEIIELNNIGPANLLQQKKGTVLKYYV